MTHAGLNGSLGSLLEGRRCLVIAEIAQAHDGSLGTAHAYIDAVADAGADVVKFQTHYAAAESTPEEPWRVRFSPQDKTRYDYWRRMEFSPDQWVALAQHAAERNLLFMSTPFSIQAVEVLEAIDLPAWKVGSGELTNLPMIRRMAQTGRPVILSSGLASWAELHQAVAVVRECEAPIAVLQCTTSYPCPPDKVGLNNLDLFRSTFGCPVGLSDHSGTIYPGLAAATLGADLIEVHVVFSRECFGPDTTSSLTTGELRQLVEGVRFIQSMRENPVEKDVFAAQHEDLRQVFGKSIVVHSRLPEGHKLRLEDLSLKKPGTGLPPARLTDYVGRTLRREVAADTILQEEDVE